MMKRLLSLALAFLIACAPVQAQFFPFPGPGVSGAGGGGGNVNWTATANPAIQAGTANPQSFSSVAIGTAASNRYVIVCTGQNNNGPVTAMTIGGVTATKAVDSVGTSGTYASLWYANVTTGTTATIDVTSSSAFPSFFGIAVGIISTATPSPSSTSSAPGAAFRNDPQTTSGSVTVPSNGVAVLCGNAANPNATPTYNNWIKDYDNQIQASNLQILLGHLNSTGTPSVSGYAFSDFSIAAASWGP